MILYGVGGYDCEYWRDLLYWQSGWWAATPADRGLT